MASRTIPLLWLCGPSGVGKTTAGWAIYRQLRDAGIDAAYVDIDQLGMCYPEPSSDPDRHRMKEHNLDAVLANFGTAGAKCVVASGVVDVVNGVQRDLIPHAELTLCRLRADRDELRQRFVGRGSYLDQVEVTLRDAELMDAGARADLCVDTSGQPATDVVRLVRERIGAWPGPVRAQLPERDEPTESTSSTCDGPILWVCGATGVGKSTVGFEVYRRLFSAGVTAAYIDTDQAAFCGTAIDHRLRAENLAAMWQTYRGFGARGLVVVGPMPDESTLQTYTKALPCATFTVCRLDAGRDELTRRIMLRGHGGGWAQPGDPLIGQPSPVLRRFVDQAVAEAEALERAAVGIRVETDGLTVDAIADEIVARTGGLL